jgi:hypothetical protein
MADLINELASKAGVSPDMAKKGLGTLLASLKHVLPAESFQKIEGTIPNSDQLMALAPPEEGASGGILAAVKNMAGKLFGGGGEGAAALAAHFGQLGFSADQARNFITHVVEFLKSRLPPDALKKLGALLPAGAEKGG